MKRIMSHALSDYEKELLDKRLEEDDANPRDTIPSEKVNESLLAKSKRQRELRNSFRRATPSV